VIRTPVPGACAAFAAQAPRRLLDATCHAESHAWVGQIAAAGEAVDVQEVVARVGVIDAAAAATSVLRRNALVAVCKTFASVPLRCATPRPPISSRVGVPSIAISCSRDDVPT